MKIACYRFRNGRLNIGGGTISLLMLASVASPQPQTITGSGTAGKIAKFTNTYVIGNSSCSDNGNDFTCATDLDLNLSGTGRFKMPRGFYEPSDSFGFNPEWKMLTTGSTELSAGLWGLRRSTLQLFDNKAGDVDNAMITLDLTARYCHCDGVPPNQKCYAPIVDATGSVTYPTQCNERFGVHKTGMQMFSYAMPEPNEYGGDNSTVTLVQTGGGNALTVYKLSNTHRPFDNTQSPPVRYEDYSNARAGAMEVGTSDGSWAGLFEAGTLVGGEGETKSSNAIIARIDNASSKGILIAPGDPDNPNPFNARRALQVGSYNIDAPNSNVKFSIRLDGRTTIGTDSPPLNPLSGTTMLEVKGSETNTQIGAGDRSAMKLVNTSIGAGTLSELQFGISSTTKFAAISGVLSDSLSNTSGDLVFGVRPSTTDTTLTAGMTLTRSKNLKLAGHFIPVNDGWQDLGTPTARWRDLYLSGAFTTTRTTAGAATGRNEAGVGLRLEGGTGTGQAPGGDVTITTSPSVASGKTVQTSIDRLVVVAKGKVLTDELPVGLFEIAMPAGSTSGGAINLTVQVVSGTDRQVLTQEVLWACANGTGEAACTLSPPRDTELLTAGTITNNWTWNWDPDNSKITIEVTADTSLVPSGLNGFVAYFQIQNNGEQAVTILK